MKINITPKNDATNGWSRILPDRVPTPGLSENTSADWLVVGGGFTGLAAARRLAQIDPMTELSSLRQGFVGKTLRAEIPVLQPMFRTWILLIPKRWRPTLTARAFPVPG